MNDHQSINQFNYVLDRILQGLPPGRGKLTIEDRYSLVLAKRAAQIDLSKQNKIKENLRYHLEELARIRLPHASNLSLNLWFRPRRLTWVGLVILVQLVLGSVFGSMIAQSYSTVSIQLNDCVTPPAALSLTRSPDIDPSKWIGKDSPGLGDHQIVDNPQPIPTPLAPLINTIHSQYVVTSIETPEQITNPIAP